MKIVLDHKHKVEENHSTPIAAYTVSFEARSKEDLALLRSLFRPSHTLKATFDIAREYILTRHPDAASESHAIADILSKVSQSIYRIDPEILPSIATDLEPGEELDSIEVMNENLKAFERGQSDADPATLAEIDAEYSNHIGEKEKSLDELLEGACEEIDNDPALTPEDKETKKDILRSMHRMHKLLKNLPITHL